MWYDENQFKGLNAMEAPLKVPRNEWQYRLLIRLPDYISKPDIEKIKKDAFTKKKQIDQIMNVEYFELKEGRSVQILHKGEYANEPVTLAVLHSFIEENNLVRKWSSP
jgi:hypothetical protein